MVRYEHLTESEGTHHEDRFDSLEEGHQGIRQRPRCIKMEEELPLLESSCLLGEEF